ncbi:hypothetical protein [Neobacillus terrae]|uniref:hypothetical protein n=1 Tax=Neobacillus terrae TaxID=3034837 RepID=UPI00140A20B8|nr:hypothetical protein [Neobacillus terrae]NHM32703.1 hypothetical protein [Neobacillus terrae]
MKFIIYKSNKQNGKDGHEVYGTINASSLEVASDLMYKRLRKKNPKENGQLYLIVPYTSELEIQKNKLPSLKDKSFRVLQYRCINE